MVAVGWIGAIISWRDNGGAVLLIKKPAADANYVNTPATCGNLSPCVCICVCVSRRFVANDAIAVQSLANFGLRAIRN